MSIAHLLTLIPDSVLNPLIQARENITRDSWLIGATDFALCQQLYTTPITDERGRLYTAEDIHRAVGETVGLRASRVRHIAATYRYYTDAQRAEYAILPFSHFEYAMQFPALTFDILEASLRRAGDTGRPPSVEWIEYQFSSPIRALAQQAANEMQTLDLFLQADAAAIEVNPIYPPEEPEDPGESARYFTLLETGLNTVRAIVERMRLPAGARKRVLELLGEAMQEIEKSVVHA